MILCSNTWVLPSARNLSSARVPGFLESMVSCSDCRISSGTSFSVPVRSPHRAQLHFSYPCAVHPSQDQLFCVPARRRFARPHHHRSFTADPLEMHNRGPEIPSSVSPYARLTFAQLERLSPKAENGPEKRKNDSRTSVEIVRSASSWVDIPNAWKVGGKRLDDEGAVFRSGPPCWRPPLCCVSWTLLFSARRH